MEFWIGVIASLVFLAVAIVSAVFIRKSKKWVIATLLGAIFTVVFVLYTVLTYILFGI